MKRPAAMLIPTCARYARYADLGVASLDALWPDHPPAVVVTDSGVLEYRDVISTGARTWVGVLATGLDALIARDRLRGDDWVLLVLEDHTPMTPVSSETLAACIAVAEAHATPYIKLNGNQKSADRYVARIPASAITRQTRLLDGHLVAFMSPRWPYYHSLHPALWRVGYLRTRLARARALDAESAWAFEELPSEDVPHLAANLVWPSEASGYMVRGVVQIGIVLRMKHPALAPLRRHLLRGALIDFPYRLAAILRQRVAMR